jgi:hypothetical protein
MPRVPQHSAENGAPPDRMAGQSYVKDTEELRADRTGVRLRERPATPFPDNRPLLPHKSPPVAGAQRQTGAIQGLANGGRGYPSPRLS